ncbi:hypothetical protein PR202_ga13631 [Eleusine coracana subsp. coracana]|uniref:Uncharacterized protein n=1 Tax=Eleusine coracana subsp. coracana TaxID=191504 RepID=A0AAV5CET3_ELECO|nr:hypothetical protein QOZ80_3AG0214280 [Eleusine coracana subsp. coracana]GJM96768.1 hypothetical protein PR202_ga13631 [Eleusine coracana subsp. coracana]
MGIPLRHPEHEEEEEYDDAVFYEDIQAPKFVDLTAPDAGRPTDDASWFCLRVGCDQNHEQVDPEALGRSFFMRVMAARSPNVRLHKAISRKNQSSMLKCPHSAPPKPPRARFARLSAGTEAAEKAAPRPKMRAQRICALRASPTRTKAARIEPSSARKKALTTPRSKAVRPRQEPFLSVKHRKQTVAAAERKGTVVKALFMNTPKKEVARTPVPDKGKEAVTEACSKLRKLNLACREVPSRYMLSTPKIAKKCEETTVAKSAKKGQESTRTNGKKKILGRSMKCANAEADGKGQTGCVSAAEENSFVGTASLNQQSNAVLQEVRIEVDTVRTDNSDDNKENLSNPNHPTGGALNYSSHYEGENTQMENNENVPVKVATMQNKLNPEQGGKLKTTNPRPFRLRTDERRVLKDANPERKQPFSENNSMAVLKPMNKCLAAKGRDKPFCSEKQKKQATQTGMAQLGEAKQTLNGIRCKSTKTAATVKGKVVEKSQRVPRVASTTRTAKAASAPTAPLTGKERKPSVKTSRLQAAAA